MNRSGMVVVSHTVNHYFCLRKGAQDEMSLFGTGLNCARRNNLKKKRISV